MENVSLNSIKKIAVQKAGARCDQLIDNYIRGDMKEPPEAIKQKLNEMLITECIRFSKHLIASQYDHIAPKVKDALSEEIGLALTTMKKYKMQRLDQMLQTDHSDDTTAD